MKKIWIIFSLVIISMFVAACGISTGEAVRFGKTSPPQLKQPIDSPPKEGNCKYVDFPTFNNEWSGLTYKQICANQGGMSCTAVDVKEITYVFENSACNPPTKWRDINNVLHPELCGAGVYWQDLKSLSGEETCVEGSFPSGYDESSSSEYYKSKEQFVNLDGVLCCS